MVTVLKMAENTHSYVYKSNNLAVGKRHALAGGNALAFPEIIIQDLSFSSEC